MAISSKLLSPVRAIFSTLLAGRGYSKFCNLGMTLLPNLVGYTVDGSKKLHFRFFDQHWSSMKCLNDFEPEVMAFIDRFSSGKHMFFDIGANIGYWPVALSGKENFDVVSVEPAIDSFGYLKRNIESNNLSTTIINAAVDLESGKTVELYGDKPLSRSLIPQNSGSSSQKVTTVSLDSLFEDYFASAGYDTLFVKLDIEGTELEVIKSFRALEGNVSVYLMYEDHGKDRSHKTTQYFIENSSYEVVFVDRDNLQAGYVNDLSEVENIKIDRSYGYMFIAGKVGTLSDFVNG